jgi:ParB-like chromosome segregation protein Spo0J
VRGEKRYTAAVLGAMMELPAIVRPVGAAEDTAALLVDAIVASRLRSPLTLLEEALACRRLKAEHGLTIKASPRSFR